MRWRIYPTETGPVLEIWMQDFYISCSECGREVYDPAEMTGERIVGDDGIVGWRPLCTRCKTRLGLDGPKGGAA